MTILLEYHKPMRPSISVPVALFGSLAVALFLAAPAPAQVNGAPASVTSPGFGGRAINGPPASVTSLGPQGYTPMPGPPFINGNGVHHGDHNGHNGNVDNGHNGNVDNGHHGQGDGHRHQRDNSNAVGPVWYAVPVPYAVDSAPPQDQPEADEDDADYQGGPTVYDRRGSGDGSYVPPVKQAAPAHARERAEVDPPAVDPDPPLPPTLLVFKDGRTMEVGNYAIQGATLFDLTPGHKRKVAIADLDLEATRRQNDERGITFQLPQSTRVN